jgi:hypothetical protein
VLAFTGLCFGIPFFLVKSFNLLFLTLYFDRYTAMSCATLAQHRTDRLQASNVSSVRVLCVTETGDLHILRISAAGISLEHVIPSMRMVMSGVACTFEMILATAMEVGQCGNDLFSFF